MTAPPLPLAGLRVLDLSQGVAGPYCTMLLAAQGAEVLKLEPFEGDWLRAGRHRYHGHTAAAIAVNVGKRSLALDLKPAEGQALARRLAATCDIVVESFRPAVAARLGVDHASLAALRPGLVYASISGFGQSGPLSQRGVVDQIMQACCGWMLLNASADGVPQRTRNVVVADQITGLYAYQAIASALIGRLRGGPGAYLDISLMGAMAAFLAPRITAHVLSGGEAVSAYFAPPTGEYPTRDGQLMIAARKPVEFDWFCDAVGRPELRSDPRFATLAARVAHVEALDQEITASLAGRSALEWEELLNARGVMASAVRSVGEFIATPQMQAAGLVEAVEIEGMGRCPLVQLPGAPAWRTRSAPLQVPAVGQHGREILAQAGLSGAEIARCVDTGLVRLSPSIPA